LTKSVTHLIAATPSGKKYEHAVNWHMKIVTWEWFEESRERGLALDEQYYHPSMPVEERGKGAWGRRRSSPPATGKRARETGPAEAVNLLRRKLRRSASSRLGSQSEALWAGITSAGLEPKHDETDDWTETTLAQQAQQAPQPLHTSATADIDATAQGALPQKDPASRARGPFADDLDGIFAGSLVYPLGFDQSKVCSPLVLIKWLLTYIDDHPSRAPRRQRGTCDS
jgi:DNA replication regulator DPB11